MRTGKRHFRPPLWATLGALALGGTFVAAGFWQLQRAAEKDALIAAFERGRETVPLAGPVTETAAPGLRYRLMRLHGRYDPDHQILLDARVAGGRNGYEVLTPLRSDHSAVLVNRGWLPAAADRSQLPDVTVPGGERTVTGRLDRLPRPGLTITAPPEAGAGWPRRMLFPTAEEISAALGYRVRDYQLLLAPEEPEGYQRRWEPQTMSPRQHLGYAIQWFALAVALVVIYVALNLKRPDA